MISMVLQAPYPPDNIVVEDLIKAVFENGREKNSYEMDTFAK